MKHKRRSDMTMDSMFHALVMFLHLGSSVAAGFQHEGKKAATHTGLK